MYKLNLKHLRFVVIFTAVSFSVKAEISNEEFSMMENSDRITYYAKEAEVRSATFCRFLCGREEGCTGVGIEHVGRTVNCYFLNVNYSGQKTISPSSQIEHWIKDTHDRKVGCPYTFASINGTGCYHPVFNGSKLNWTEAEEACQKLDSRANSLRLETDKEQTAVHTYMREEGVPEVWTGARDLDGSDTYRWSGSDYLVPLDPSLWYTGEPKHNNGDCAYMHAGTISPGIPDGHMHVDSCDNKYHYICEIQL